MSKGDVLDRVFTVNCKLDLMQTILEILIDTMEEPVGLSPEAAESYFKMQKRKIMDLIHIVFDGVLEANRMLEELNNEPRGEAAT